MRDFKHSASPHTVVKIASSIRRKPGASRKVICKDTLVGESTYSRAIRVLSDPKSKFFDPDVSFLHGVDAVQRPARADFLIRMNKGEALQEPGDADLMGVLNVLRAMKDTKVSVGKVKGDVYVPFKDQETGGVSITPILSPSTGEVTIEAKPQLSTRDDQAGPGCADRTTYVVPTTSESCSGQPPVTMGVQSHEGAIKHLPMNKPITFTIEDKPKVDYSADDQQFKQHLRSDIFDVASDICRVIHFIKFGSRQERDDAVALLRACRSQLTFMRQTVVSAGEEIDGSFNPKAP